MEYVAAQIIVAAVLLICGGLAIPFAARFAPKWQARFEKATTGTVVLAAGLVLTAAANSLLYYLG